MYGAGRCRPNINGDLCVSSGGGAQGFQGYQGSDGSQGSQGSQGVQGVEGSQGNQGFQGVQGSQGFQGVQGFQGFQGNAGTGSQGFQGDTGSQGFQGFQGNQGLGVGYPVTLLPNPDIAVASSPGTNAFSIPVNAVYKTSIFILTLIAETYQLGIFTNLSSGYRFKVLLRHQDGVSPSVLIGQSVEILGDEIGLITPTLSLPGLGTNLVVTIHSAAPNDVVYTYNVTQQFTT